MDVIVEKYVTYGKVANKFQLYTIKQGINVKFI
jgi:hypothetical protein